MALARRFGAEDDSSPFAPDKQLLGSLRVLTVVLKLCGLSVPSVADVRSVLFSRPGDNLQEMFARCSYGKLQYTGDVHQVGGLGRCTRRCTRRLLLGGLRARRDGRAKLAGAGSPAQVEFCPFDLATSCNYQAWAYTTNSLLQAALNVSR
jgi:hypothetical protein